jgi:hypothetical protein
VSARSVRHRRIPQPNGLRRDVVSPAALTAAYTPDRHTSTSSHPRIAPSIAAVICQQPPSLYRMAVRMLPIW